MYCKIFVNYQGDKPTLLNVLAKELQAKSIDVNTLLFPWGDLYISCNDEYDPEKVQKVHGFLYYPYLLDMEITTTELCSHYRYDFGLFKATRSRSCSGL